MTSSLRVMESQVVLFCIYGKKYSNQLIIFIKVNYNLKRGHFL